MAATSSLNSRGGSTSFARPSTQSGPIATSSSSPLAHLITTRPSEKLTYTIANVSSYSGSYHPSQIIVDRPNDLRSRWSGASVAAPAQIHGNTGALPTASGSATPSTTSDGSKSLRQTTLTRGQTSTVAGKQHIVLKLPSPAIVNAIYFGKYCKPHPCNLRDFKVYGGVSPEPHTDRWIRILRAGLKNSSTPEEFALKWTDADGMPLPFQYIKIVPLATHSPNYNFSVWHVALHGWASGPLIPKAVQQYDEYRESMTTRLILKHLRERGHHAAFKELLHSSKLEGGGRGEGPPRDDSTAPSASGRRPFEHPIITRLFQAILRGDWETAEQCLDHSAGLAVDDDDDEGIETDPHSSLFSCFVDKSAQVAQWARIDATDAHGEIPAPRGGHHMVMDSNHQVAYLFGGWDGNTELNDLWAYHMAESRWRCISKNTSLQGGPSPRSCHKMAFDSRSGLIYVMGRYVDYETARNARAQEGASGASRAASGANTPQGPSSPGPRATSASASTLAASSSYTEFLPGRSSPQQPSSTPGSQTNVNLPSVPSPSRPSAGATLHPDTAVRLASLRADGGTPAWLYASDFYRFSTRSERWDRLSIDTHSEGGPKLVYDPDMVIDEDNQMLYVFGGRVAHWDPKHFEYSGMWRYDCIQRTWAFFFDDNTWSEGTIPARSGHSVLLDKVGSGGSRPQLWILGGQRGDQYFTDMHVYNVASGEIRQIDSNYEVNAGGPEGGFTNRAVIDSARREIYLFSGLTKRQQDEDFQQQLLGEKGASTVSKHKSEMWMYSINRGVWTLVWQSKGAEEEALELAHEAEEEEDNEEIEEEEGENQQEGIIEDIEPPTSRDEPNADGDELMEELASPALGAAPQSPASPRSNRASGTDGRQQAGSRQQRRRRRSLRREREPIPRFATSVVFDPKSEQFVMFGGNPTETQGEETRLNDLWSLHLSRPQTAEILRQAKFALRQQRFKEMAAAVPRVREPTPPQGGMSGSGFLSAAGGAATSVISAESGMLAMEALMYLQTEVAAVVDHSDPQESRQFRSLVSGLLSGGSGEDDDDNDGDDSSKAERETEGEVGTPTASPMPPRQVQRDVPRESDGLPSVRSAPLSPSSDAADSNSNSHHSHGQGDDSEMLSISQTLPSLPSADGSNTLDLNRLPPLDVSQRPSALYRQRLQLYRRLLQFYPAESIEPQEDLGVCVESFVARSLNRGGK